MAFERGRTDYLSYRATSEGGDDTEPFLYSERIETSSKYEGADKGTAPSGGMSPTMS
jgi:hypothetical protein